MEWFSVCSCAEGSPFFNSSAWSGSTFSLSNACGRGVTRAVEIDFNFLRPEPSFHIAHTHTNLSIPIQINNSKRSIPFFLSSLCHWPSPFLTKIKSFNSQFLSLSLSTNAIDWCVVGVCGVGCATKNRSMFWNFVSSFRMTVNNGLRLETAATWRVHTSSDKN